MAKKELTPKQELGVGITFCVLGSIALIFFILGIARGIYRASPLIILAMYFYYEGFKGIYKYHHK